MDCNRYKIMVEILKTTEEGKDICKLSFKRWTRKEHTAKKSGRKYYRSIAMGFDNVIIDTFEDTDDISSCIFYKSVFTTEAGIDVYFFVEIPKLKHFSM